MSRTNFGNLIEADFLATAHISLGGLADVVRNALLQGIVPNEIRNESNHPPDGNHPNGWTEINLVSLQPPLVTPQEVESVPVPIPSGITVEDGNGNRVPLTDPVYPDERQEQDLLLFFQVPFTLESNNEQLSALDITQVIGTLDLLVRPYVSPAEGIGFVRYDFDVTVTQTLTTDSSLLYEPIAAELRTIFYPQIIDLLEAASFAFPEVSGLSVRAARVFPHLDEDLPATLVLGLGGTGSADDLLPLLDANDDLTVTVSKALFDQKVSEFNEDLPNRTVNWDERRRETLRFIKLQLQDGSIRLETEIFIEPFGLLNPDACVEVKGPLTFSFEVTGINSRLVASGSGLDVSIDVDWWADLLRAFADIFTLGLAELYFTPEIGKAEGKARGSVIGQVGDTLQEALLGSFPSGNELFGRNVFMSRESAVMWGTPDYISIKPEGLVLGGPAIGGIKHTARRMRISQVYRRNGAIRSYAFEDEFHLSKERTIEHYREGRIRIPGVRRVKGKTGDYLRDKADKKTEDNLSERPFFNPTRAEFPSANNFEPLEEGTKYSFDGGGNLAERE